MNHARFGSCWGIVLPACLLSLTIVPGLAQTTTQLPTPLPAALPIPSPPTPAPSPFAGVTAFGQMLAKQGVYLQLGYNYDMSANVAGGLRTGAMPTGELFFGSVVDLQTLAGIMGASLHVTFDERSGIGVNGIVGTQGPLQANSGPTRATRLSELFWEQGFYDDRIDLRIGRTNPTLDFAVSDISCQFVGSIICAQPGSWYFSNNSEAYPASSWGGFLNVVPVPHVYVRTGVYDDDTSQLDTDQNGFNWNVAHSSGVFVPLEAGYQTNFDNARYPAKYDIGGYWDAASYTTPSGVPMQGRTAVYAQVQQTVWRPSPRTRQSLTLFGGAIVYNGGAPYWSQIYVGLFDRGPFITRPEDTVGLIASYYRNNGNEQPNKPAQWAIELNYGISLAQGVTFKPYMQYVIAPNDFLAPVGTEEPSNALIAGFQVSLNLGELFEMPQFVAH